MTEADHAHPPPLLGRPRRFKYVPNVPHAYCEYWMPCMSCQGHFVTSTRSGHLKCPGCRDSACQCADCTIIRAERSRLVDAGLYSEEMRP